MVDPHSLTLYSHTSGTEFMILPQSYPSVLFLMILSLLCLGSWASAFKFAGKWRFEMFYFDFAIGLLVASVIYAFHGGQSRVRRVQFPRRLAARREAPVDVRIHGRA